ncbi:MAG: DUF5654 family protein [Patescibacteria group bacterium]
MTISYMTLATSALGFTVALAWNDAVSKMILHYFPATDKNSALKATIAYAVAITILVIVVVGAINHARKLAHYAGLRMKQRRASGSGFISKAAITASNAPTHMPVVKLWEPPGS